MKLDALTRILVLSFFLIPFKTLAGEVVMINGDRLTGEVIKADTDKLVMATEHSAEVSIALSTIESIMTDREVIVRLDDKTLLSGSLIEAPAGMIKIDTTGEVVPLARITHINPPAYLSGEGITWRGNVNAGASVTDGNTDTETTHADAEVIGRTHRQRQTVSGQYYYATDDGIESENRMYGLAKYDYFYQPKLFATANVSAARDKFQALNLRLIYGLGMGYQFIENVESTGSFELGLNYIVEDKSIGEDDEYSAGYWSFRYDTYLINRSMQLFHNHNLSVSLEDSEDMLAKLETGLRLFFNNINATAKVQYEWDNTPAEGNERGDTIYIFSIGYSW